MAGTSAADLLKAQTMKSSSDSRRSIPGSSSSTPPKASTKKKKKGKDSGTSSEEERWLDAIKSGKLEEVFISCSLFHVKLRLSPIFIYLPISSCWIPAGVGRENQVPIITESSSTSNIYL